MTQWEHTEIRGFTQVEVCRSRAEVLQALEGWNEWMWDSGHLPYKSDEDDDIDDLGFGWDDDGIAKTIPLAGHSAEQLVSWWNDYAIDEFQLLNNKESE